MANEWVGLADAIAALRRELTTATTAGKDSDLRFGLGPVEMEFLLKIKREDSDEAEVQLGVVTIGTEDSVTSDSAHRVKLSLQPQDRRGRRAEISDVEDMADTE